MQIWGGVLRDLTDFGVFRGVRANCGLVAKSLDRSSLRD